VFYARQQIILTVKALTSVPTQPIVYLVVTLKGSQQTLSKQICALTIKVFEKIISIKPFLPLSFLDLIPWFV
jgi:hypothetical protein